MRRLFAGTLLFALSVPCVGTDLEGRWEGVVLVPERPLRLVVDLAQEGGNAWTGSLVMPGLGIKGAPLAIVAVDGSEVRFESRLALAERVDGPATFVARLGPDGTLAGEMRHAGNQASFALKRTGNAQVDTPARSTPVTSAVEHEWRGQFELGGYPRHVTLVFANRREGGATARFLIVGKQSNELPIDLVVQDGNFVRVESAASQIAFEGRLAPDRTEIAGVLELGSLELPLVIHRWTESRP
jgi:hypothetical protein